MLPALQSREDQIWYKSALSNGQYVLDSSTSVAERNAIGYRFDLFTGFGELSNSSLISLETQFTDSIVSSKEFENATEGEVWIRLQNISRLEGDDLEVEFTITQ